MLTKNESELFVAYLRLLIFLMYIGLLGRLSNSESAILDNSTNIIESRLAGWWAYKLKSDCVRIWLNVSEQERARRVTIREGTTIDEAISANKARLLVDNERYQKMYGLTPDDPTPYTHIIDATDITAEEVLGEAIKILGVE